MRTIETQERSKEEALLYKDQMNTMKRRIQAQEDTKAGLDSQVSELMSNLESIFYFDEFKCNYLC